jgi:hypothetical protein
VPQNSYRDRHVLAFLDDWLKTSGAEPGQEYGYHETLIWQPWQAGLYLGLSDLPIKNPLADMPLEGSPQR